ncbi:porin family protein [Rhizosphaericola mali]|uniref:PorT family protein n=1 Tax=Rhizosphaericola mali TaxID=2545455 RepID=A0A5P2G1R9_9BACT|nr:porin family protein [Rhizosphaericola mali]QES87790.1 PorT family protein [Rhizosphaericola mali]
MLKLNKVFVAGMLVFTGFCSRLHAQDIHFGIKAGPEFGKVDGKSLTSAYKAGYQAGAFAEIRFDKWGIQPEVLFSQTNTETKDGNALSQVGASALIPNVKAKLNYLSVPVLVNLKIINILDFQVGPQFNVSTSKEHGLSNEVKSAFKSGEVDAAAGFQLRVAKFRAYARYNIGLTGVKSSATEDNTNTNDGSTWRRQAFQFGIGYAIF